MLPYDRGVSLWGQVFAAGYDRVMASAERAGLGAHRERLIGELDGRVLEIGGGTGANLPFYSSAVRELTIVEPERPMARRLEMRLRDHPHLAPGARVIAAAAEQLPLADDSCDVAVSTLVLCTVRDPARSLAEIRRVLVPGGSLVFLEHVRAEEPRLAAWQDRLHGVHKFAGHGCHCNRPTLETIEAAGFQVTQLERDRMRRTLPIVSPLIAGRAVNPV